MTIIYSYHEGSQSIKPKAIETMSSTTEVYLRRNIRQISRADPLTDAPVTIWAYEEAILSVKDYEIYQKEVTAELFSKVSEDNLSLMGAITESYEHSLAVEENQLIIMSALADLYDAIVGA